MSQASPQRCFPHRAPVSALHLHEGHVHAHVGQLCVETHRREKLCMIAKGAACHCVSAMPALLPHQSACVNA